MTSLSLRSGGPAEHPLAAAERLFRHLADERLDLLRTAWVRLDVSRHIAEALGDIRSVAHKIAGTAGALGHSDLGALAAEVERLCLEGAGRDDLQRALRPLIFALAELTEE